MTTYKCDCELGPCISNTIFCCPYGHDWKETTQYEIKEVKAEPKRYRLEIPDMIPTEYCSIVTKILEDTSSQKETIVYQGGTISDFLVDELPREWLIPIKPKKMTAEKIAKMVFDRRGYELQNKPAGLFIEVAEEGIKEGERKEQKKHEQKQSFDEWLDINLHHSHGELSSIPFNEKTWLKITWNAALKSRGYEEE